MPRCKHQRCVDSWHSARMRAATHRAKNPRVAKLHTCKLPGCEATFTRPRYSHRKFCCTEHKELFHNAPEQLRPRQRRFRSKRRKEQRVTRQCAFYECGKRFDTRRNSPRVFCCEKHKIAANNKTAWAIKKALLASGVVA